MVHYTPTEKRIMEVLSDGEAHPRSELMACLEDEMAETVTMAMHVSNIRKKLRPSGRTIVCVYNGNRRPVAYQLFRRVSVK